MKKELSQMSLEELWELFPIFLTEHNSCWKKWYETEEKLLKEILPEKVIISHIGSTAIEKIWAKPIIDILIESSKLHFAHIKSILTENGYICMAEDENRISFNKGYTINGFAEKVFHLHVREYGDNKEIFFCRYLNEYPHIAKEYEAMKLRLWQIYPNNRDAYTDAKSDFIARHTEDALKKYGNI